MKLKKVILFLLLVCSLCAVLMISSFGVTTATVQTAGSNLNLRSEPLTGSIVTVIPNGSTVTVLETVNVANAENPVWFKVTYLSYTGYVSKNYLTNFVTTDETPGTDDSVPDIYKSYIASLKAVHPNWQFQFYNTGLDWNEVIRNEAVVGRSAIAGSNPISYRSTTVNFSGTGAKTATIKETVNVRTGPASSYSLVKENAPAGTTCNLIGISGNWYQISFVLDGISYEGYASSSFFSGVTGTVYGCDEGYLNIRETASSSSACVVQAPNGTILNIIKKSDNWYQVTCTVGGNTYSGYAYSSYVKDIVGGGTYTPVDGSTWFQAHGQVIRYYMDPRNLLTEDRVFQFEKLSYDSNYHTLEGVQTILRGSFMENAYITSDERGEPSNGDVSGDDEFSILDMKLTLQYCSGLITLTDAQKIIADYDGDGNVTVSDAQLIINDLCYGPTAGRLGQFKTISYAEAILNAGRINGVSPYHLASRIIQEVGRNGSGSTSGTYSTNPGIYNFYNIGASAGADPISNGLAWAAKIYDNGNELYGRPWTSPYKSIIGGAQWIADGYINVGQDTLYFQKFSVVNSSKLYWHQYMSNIQAPSSEAYTVKSGYVDLGILDNGYVFEIPLYNNMPSDACTLPAWSDSPNMTPDY